MRQIVVITVILVGALSIGLRNISESPESNEFEIGVLACLSGECAEWGENTVKGLQLATAQLNRNGGVLGRKVKLRVQDTQEAVGGAMAVSAFRNLVSSDSPRYFVGPSWTPAGLALAPIVAKQKEIIVTSPSLGVADFNEASANLFNTWPHDSYATIKLARHAYTQGHRKIAILSSTQPWEQNQGDTFEAEFIRLGGSIILKSEPIAGLQDYKSIATRVKSLQPDAVFMSNFNSMANAAIELHRVNYKGQKYCILMDETRIKAAAGTLSDAIFASYPEASDTFAKAFEAMHGEKPGVSADTAYDTLMLYADAIKAANTFDVEVVREKLKVAEWNGASGNIEFDQAGGVKKDPVLYIVKNNSWQEYLG